MSRNKIRLATGATAMLTSVIAVAAPSVAATTDTSVLQCGSTPYTVDGFGRGQVLHVTGSERNFIVTRAVRGDGNVVFDSPATADRSTVICTTVTPTGTAFTFTGFFTPGT